jgi:hypothetical protein
MLPCYVGINVTPCDSVLKPQAADDAPRQMLERIRHAIAHIIGNERTLKLRVWPELFELEPYAGTDNPNRDRRARKAGRRCY